jgi:uncharacterized protein YfiM (DUF2279 family)
MPTLHTTQNVMHVQARFVYTAAAARSGGAMEYATGCGPRWCSEPDDIWGCAFPPNMLNRMMELYDDKRVGSGWSYNEIVIDPAHMAIEAVIYGSQLQPGDVSAADVHSR